MVIFVGLKIDTFTESQNPLLIPRHPNHAEQQYLVCHPQPHLRHQQLHRRRTCRFYIDGLGDCFIARETAKAICKDIHHPRLCRTDDDSCCERDGVGGCWEDCWGYSTVFCIAMIKMAVASVFVA
jgi:hypothetical protein